MALERLCVRQLRRAKAGGLPYTDLLPLAQRLPAYMLEGLNREAAFRAFLENRPHLFASDDLGGVSCAPGAWPCSGASPAAAGVVVLGPSLHGRGACNCLLIRLPAGAYDLLHVKRKVLEALAAAPGRRAHLRHALRRAPALPPCMHTQRTSCGRPQAGPCIPATQPPPPALPTAAQRAAPAGAAQQLVQAPGATHARDGACAAEAAAVH